jgi:hypothetical protein
MTRKKAEPSEYDHQCALFDWFSLHETRIPELKYIFATANGIRVTIGVAAKMKRSGMKKGVVDVFVSIPAQGYHGFYFDMKVKGNSLTVDQRLWLAAMQGYGYKTGTFYTWWDAAAAVLDYLGFSEYTPELIGDPAQYVKRTRQTRQDGSGDTARTKTRASTSKRQKPAQTLTAQKE